MLSAAVRTGAGDATPLGEASGGIGTLAPAASSGRAVLGPGDPCRGAGDPLPDFISANPRPADSARPILLKCIKSEYFCCVFTVHCATLPPMLVSVDALPDTLRQHLPSLHACVKAALTDFVAAHRDRRADYTSRTEASLIHDYMVKHAKAQFPGSWTRKHNLFLIRVGQDYLVKLKRLDHHFHASRIPTHLSLKFEDQQQLPLFDDLDRTHLHLGYQVDPLAISQSTIWLVRPDGPLVRFAAELSAAGHHHQVVEALPIQSATAPRIRPKPSIPTHGVKAVSSDS